MAQLAAVSEAAGMYPSTWAALALVERLTEAAAQFRASAREEEVR